MGNKSAKQDKTVLDEKDITLLLENTNFTREQILEWHKGFIVSCLSRLSYAK
jgi:NACalpha-BTF3-like transcription factor